MATKTLEQFLSKFPNNTTSWAEATDEIRDIARTVKEYYNEYNTPSIEACDFRQLNTPSDWNTVGKEYILSVYSKLKGPAKEQFNNYLKDCWEIVG